MTDASADDLRPVRPLDARSLRGLAHPLRMRLLSALREYGPATASQLADRFGESSGSTSYHLRQLAAYGFVEDDPEHGTGRERWWRTVYRANRIDSVGEILYHPDPSVRGAMSTFLHEHAADHGEQLSTWLGTMHEWPREWQTTWDLSDFTLRLTPELAQQLIDETHELLESYRDRLAQAEAAAAAAEASAGGEREAAAGGTPAAEQPAAVEAATVRFHLHAFPRPGA